MSSPQWQPPLRFHSSVQPHWHGVSELLSIVVSTVSTVPKLFNPEGLGGSPTGIGLTHKEEWGDCCLWLDALVVKWS